MALVVEDGSGKATGNSFNEVAAVLAYATDRGLEFAGSAAELITACILAGDYLRNELRFRYVGTRQYAIQRMPWPRTGASEWGGLAVPESTVPWRLTDAHAELAIMSNAGIVLQDALTNGGLLLASKRIDVLEKSWFAPSKFQILTPIPGETLLTGIMGYLAPLLYLPGRMKLEGSLFQAPDVSPFSPGEYDNPPASVTQ